MDELSRRKLLKTTGVSVGIALGTGTAGGTGASRLQQVQSQATLSTFNATAQTARLAIDTDDPTETVTIDPGAPFLSVQNAEISDTGDVTVTDINAGDLTNVILGLEPVDTIIEILEGIDIEEDVINELDLQTDIVGPLAEFINQLGDNNEGLTETQATAIGDLVTYINNQLELLPPDFPVPIGNVVRDVLQNPETEINGLLSFLDIDTTQGFIDFVLTFIEGLEPGEYEALKGFIIEQIESFNLEGAISLLSLDVSIDSLQGTISSNDAPVLLELPLNTGTATIDLSLETDPVIDLPSVDLTFDITLTSGPSGAVEGTFVPNVSNDTAAVTMLDNEFVANITSFDLVGLIQSIDLVSLIETLFEAVDGLDPTEFDVPGFVQDADIVSIVENANILQMIDDQITDQPGRHVIEVDFDIGFSDLAAVLDGFAVPPGAPGGGGSSGDGDGDYKYEDVDGDGSADITDVQALFDGLEDDSLEGWAYDFDNDGRTSIFDVQALFEETS